MTLWIWNINGLYLYGIKQFGLNTNLEKQVTMTGKFNSKISQANSLHQEKDA